MLKRLLAALALSLVASAADADVTLINVFEVPEGGISAAIDAWEASRDFLKTQPGYVTTSLHQALVPTARFTLINIATWTDPDAFHAAIAAMRQAGIYPQIPGLVPNPALYTVIRTDQ